MEMLPAGDSFATVSQREPGLRSTDAAAGSIQGSHTSVTSSAAMRRQRAGAQVA